MSDKDPDPPILDPWELLRAIDQAEHEWFEAELERIYGKRPEPDPGTRRIMFPSFELEPDKNRI